jgi:hypothetical protein
MDGGKCYTTCMERCTDDCRKNPKEYPPVGLGGCTRLCDELCFAECFPSADLELYAEPLGTDE